MQIPALDLINNLIAELKRQNQITQSLLLEDDHVLNWRSNATSWSVLECIEHLKRYNDFYIPEITKSIEKTSEANVEIFKSGWLGNYFANSMMPKKKLNKMKTFKGMNPIQTTIDKNVLNNFSLQNNQLISLLEKAKTINLNKAKTAISVSTVVKLKLGDTFRFLINHQTRHFQQLNNVLEKYALVNKSK